MSIIDALNTSKGSYIKARRLFMRANRMSSDDWYRVWPSTAWIWNAYATRTRP